MQTEVGSRIGVVLIGRNEGDRLKACIQSVSKGAIPVVYVDSGSTDDSVNWAASQGVQVVNLDMSVPFTAARARNEGFARLMQVAPDLDYVQFVDGDCQIVADWMTYAATWLDANSDVAVACGRRREVFPERSVYNALCDIEWNTPSGEAKSCGGDAMFRVSAFQAVKGFRDDLIAGEEPELCVRLRASGNRVMRLDHEMTLHDAAMMHFSQWWKRTVRSGFAYANGAWLHGMSEERHWVRENWRILFWGGLLPLFSLFAFLLYGWPALMLLLAYPIQVFRIGRGVTAVVPAGMKWKYAFFTLLSRFPEFQGWLRFHVLRLAGRRSHLIEYKRAGQ